MMKKITRNYGFKLIRTGMVNEVLGCHDGKFFDIIVNGNVYSFPAIKNEK